MYSLNLRTVKSPYNDITKGSVLSQEEVDNNFIKLKGDSIFSSSTDNGVVSLMKLNGETIEFTGGTTNFNTITKAELDNLIKLSGLTEGTFYKILGVNIDLYGGTDIILQATSNTTLSIYGNGIFYNPKYDSIKIWDNKTKILINNQIGDFQPNENITADNGATGTIIGLPGTESLILIQISGDWETVANITGDTSLTTADMTSFENQYTYAIGAKVIWGGKVWRNLNGNLGSEVNNMNLDSEWELIPFNESDYIKVSDLIGYDITNDHIFYRKDKMNEITIVYDLFPYKFFVNSIQKFPWGNSNVFNTKIDNGFIDNLINFNGGYISNLNIESIGAFNFDYIGRNANIENLTIKSLSYFDGLILGDGNSIQNIYLDESTSIFYIVVANKDNFNANGGVYNIKLNQGINVDFFENNVYIYNLILYPNALLTNIELASAGNYQTETSLNNIILYNDAKLYNINLEKGAAFNYCTFGSKSKISEIDLGIFCAMANITTGTDCTIANIKLDGASGQLQGSLSSYLGKITFYNSVVFVSIHLGLATQMTNIVGADGVTIQDIITNNNTYIGNLRIALGGSLVGLSLGVFSNVNQIYIGGNSMIGNIYIKGQASLENINIGDNSGFYQIDMDNLSNISYIVLDNKASMYRISLESNTELVRVNVNAFCSLEEITIGSKCRLADLIIASTIQNKVISIGFNNFPAELDITNMTSLPLSPISYAGDVTLTSSNPTETIDEILLSKIYPVTIKPAAGLTLNIVGTPATSITSSKQIISPVPTITLNGDTHDQAKIIRDSSYSRIIDYQNYL